MSHHRSGRPTVVCPSVSGDGWPERVLSPPLSFAWRSDRSLADLMVVRPAGRSIWFECRPTAWIEGVGKTYWQFTFIPRVEPLSTRERTVNGRSYTEGLVLSGQSDTSLRTNPPLHVVLYLFPSSLSNDCSILT